MTLNNSHKTRLLIASYESLKNGAEYHFSRDWNCVSLTVYYTCSMYSGFKFKWYHMLELVKYIIL